MQWNKIEDELPPLKQVAKTLLWFSDEVLVFIRDERLATMAYRNQYDGECVWRYCSNGDVIDQNITHWIPVKYPKD